MEKDYSTLFAFYRAWLTRIAERGRHPNHPDVLQLLWYLTKLPWTFLDAARAGTTCTWTVAAVTGLTLDENENESQRLLVLRGYCRGANIFVECRHSRNASSIGGLVPVLIAMAERDELPFLCIPSSDPGTLEEMVDFALQTTRPGVNQMSAIRGFVKQVGLLLPRTWTSQTAGDEQLLYDYFYGAVQRVLEKP